MGTVIKTQADSQNTLLGIQPVFPLVIEDNTKAFAFVNSTYTTLVAGQPVTNVGGVLKNVTAITDVVYGLAKATISPAAVLNEVNDQGFGMYGSKNITAAVFGVYDITNFDYTLADGTVVAFKAFAAGTDGDAIVAADIGKAVYTNASGLIVGDAGKQSSMVPFGTLMDISDDGATIQVFIGKLPGVAV